MQKSNGLLDGGIREFNPVVSCLPTKNLHYYQDLAYSMDTNESGTIDLPEFLQMMATKMHDANVEDEIVEAFKVRK